MRVGIFLCQNNGMVASVWCTGVPLLYATLKKKVWAERRREEKVCAVLLVPSCEDAHCVAEALQGCCV